MINNKELEEVEYTQDKAPTMINTDNKYEVETNLPDDSTILDIDCNIDNCTVKIKYKVGDKVEESIVKKGTGVELLSYCVKLYKQVTDKGYPGNILSYNVKKLINDYLVEELHIGIHNSKYTIHIGTIAEVELDVDEMLQLISMHDLY